MAGQKKIFLRGSDGILQWNTWEKRRFHHQKKGEFGMYLDHEWYRLNVHPDKTSEDPVDGLDVSILQMNLLDPVLGIENPRTDENIEFVGGIRGLGELEKRCHEDMEVAFFQCIRHLSGNCWPWLTQDGSCRQNPHGSNQNFGLACSFIKSKNSRERASSI